ncbi:MULTISPECIES: PPC domain-containing DNA-binding protein [Thermococcus]|uniref:DNA-binding protein, putative n=2 Tax=Thermococcus sibiricus TaxID=172049 RepID=C6A2G7_THESM|nr:MULTISPECIES: PPC domain-containing DNA-binding protein [Thermococcus]ACS89812.1 DNA-binding protein, putative [Thermococcus sibiricus MM 739]KUK17730.1 MAG: DNA-binding protein, putative [Thermococcus sibiricus]MBC7095954.1 DNA-binding protein [Thermococcus sp.]
MRFSKGRTFLFRIPEGKEFLNSVTEFAKKHNILIGTISAIGTLRNPKIGYFEEETKQYKVIELEGTYELISAIGNLSLKDNEPFAHIHVSLGDEEGKMFGGHLVEGEVFVAEVVVQELLGELLERKLQENGLALWDVEEF